MAKLSPVSWRELVRKFRALGFQGPYVGGKHPYMVKGDLVLTIPNPHSRDISAPLLSRILRQAGIKTKAWIDA